MDFILSIVIDKLKVTILSVKFHELSSLMLLY